MGSNIGSLLFLVAWSLIGQQPVSIIPSVVWIVRDAPRPSQPFGCLLCERGKVLRVALSMFKVIVEAPS